MLRNYLTLTIRSLRKRKLYSFINVLGLAIGMAVCLVIWRYVEFELSYDKFHKNAENIYRTTFTEYGKNWKDNWFAEFGFGIGPALINEIPEIKNFARVHPLYGEGTLISFLTNNGEQSLFHEESIYFADSSFLDMFTYEAINGELSTALDAPSSIVLTESISTRYFGATEAIGKSLHLRNKDWGEGEFIVTAVIKDLPENSHLQFNMLVSMHDLLQIEYYQDQEAAWSATNFITYVEMFTNTDIKSLEAKTKRFMDLHAGTDPLGVKLSYQPLRNVNLSPDLNNANGHLNTLHFFMLISIFILSIAWINYINLSTARATERAKEVGIKKAMGVLKSQLVKQFAFESVIINFISVMLALVLAVSLLPILSRLVDKNIAFDFSRPMVWIILSGLFCCGSLVSGTYPALVLSSFKTTEVIKGITKSGRGLVLRKALVVFQFTASLLLIAGTFIIFRQMNFMLQRDKGFNTDQMLIVNGPHFMEQNGSDQRMISFKNELLKVPSIQSVATTGAIPGGGFSFTTGVQVSGRENRKEIRESIRVVLVDTDFIETYGMLIRSGKKWDPAITSDMNSVLINEAAMERLRLGTAEQALSEKLIVNGEVFPIQGVIKNFHWNSLKSGFEPMMLRPQNVNHNLFSIQLNSNIRESIAQVESIYRSFFPGNPFNFYFLDDFFNSQYREEKQTGRLFTMFSILAIIIACLGLWGLASFTTIQRGREISIRKVLGATVNSIVTLLSIQFLKLLVISSLISTPIIWYVGNSWIDNFPFRIGMTIDVFIVPFIALTIIALSTVGIQIFRGASANPAQVLRSE